MGKVKIEFEVFEWLIKQCAEYRKKIEQLTLENEQYKKPCEKWCVCHKTDIFDSALEAKAVFDEYNETDLEEFKIFKAVEDVTNLKPKGE